MLQIASYETFKDGHVIFREGDNGDWLYIVMDGEVEITKAMGNGKIVIDVVMPGEIFGEVAYIDNKSRFGTATAKGVTEVGVIDRESFDREFNCLSGDFQKLLKTVAFRMRKVTKILLDTLAKQG